MLYVILAIFPHNDAQALAASTDRGQCLESWKTYMLNGEDFDNMPDHERQWLVKACVDLLQHGITDKQDSKVFYRMQRI